MYCQVISFSNKDVGFTHKSAPLYSKQIRGPYSNLTSDKQTKNTSLKAGVFSLCGGDEIRTHGPITQTPVFKTGAIDHSATPPCFYNS